MKQIYFDPESRSIADLVEIHPGYYLLTRINVPKAMRGRRIASSLLNEILEDADAEGVTLEIHPMPSGGLSKKELISWYERHGFQWGQSLISPEVSVEVLIRKEQPKELR